jgi:predicted nucleic-acid-binding protein
MIGLDTNIIVRYLARDDPIQSRKATRLFEKRLTHNDPGFVSIVAIAETAWVLERAYGLTAAEIAAAIESMLQTDVLVLEREQDVFTAMIALRDGLGSFADALISAVGTSAGCTCTLTLDRKASRLPNALNFPPRTPRGVKPRTKRCGKRRSVAERPLVPGAR